LDELESFGDKLELRALIGVLFNKLEPFITTMPVSTVIASFFFFFLTTAAGYTFVPKGPNQV
jgi:hypothetical protein